MRVRTSTAASTAAALPMRDAEHTTIATASTARAMSTTVNACHPLVPSASNADWPRTGNGCVPVALNQVMNSDPNNSAPPRATAGSNRRI